jgi:SH3-like domain-containing protein
MRHPNLFCAAFAAALALPPAAWGFDFRSVSGAAPMYDAPSKRAKPLFVIARDTPVEVIVGVEGWSKVRDASGAIAWMEKHALSGKRTVIVSAARAEVRGKPDDNATPVFIAEKDVVLDLIETAPPGWAKVRHRDGQTGYVRVNKVWGL